MPGSGTDESLTGIVFLSCSTDFSVPGVGRRTGAQQPGRLGCGCRPVRTPCKHTHAGARALATHTMPWRAPYHGTPKDRSPALCVWPRRFTTSGAMYSIVPQKE